MVDLAAGIADFRAGRVMSRSFSILFRNIASFGLLALLISSPTYVYAILTELANVTAFAGPLITGTVHLLLGYLIMAALTYGTMQELKGERVGPGECFSRGVALVFPVLGVAIVALLVMAVILLVTVIPGAIVVSAIATMTGSGLVSIVLTVPLFIPTVYVWIMLWVTIPVAVVERQGLRSLSRSSALTRGYRWRIFLLLLLLLAIATGVVLFTGAVEGTMSAMELSGDAVASSPHFAGQVAIEWIMSAFVSALSAVIVAVTYHDLRVAREGADTSQIAAVFD